MQTPAISHVKGTGRIRKIKALGKIYVAGPIFISRFYRHGSHLLSELLTLAIDHNASYTTLFCSEWLC